jgi:LmbE family N-acetylglucosaminyl deacetylase
VIITQPYEGGHPDHDATAWAVHAAVALQQEANGIGPEIVEMTSYHSRSGAFEFGEFLAGTGEAEFVLELDEKMKAEKRGLFACHASQTYLLNTIPLMAERFRHAPAYDFQQPPHEGKLLYEQFPWGMSGERWRALAAKAGQELGVPLRRRGPKLDGTGEGDSLEVWLRHVRFEAAARHCAGMEVRS